MAVSAKWYGNHFVNQYKAVAAADVIDFDTDTMKVSLHTVTYVPAQDTDDFWNDATNEISGTGYTTKGVTLGSKTVTYDAGTNECRLDAGDAQWTASSFTARIAVVYKDGAGADTTEAGLRGRGAGDGDGAGVEQEFEAATRLRAGGCLAPCRRSRGLSGHHPPC